MSAAVSKITSAAEAALREEAVALEQLRRKIAAASAGGVAAEPALLSEFARAQKTYLEHKIELEKRKRLGEVPTPKLPTPSESAPTVIVRFPVETTTSAEVERVPAEINRVELTAPSRKTAAHWVWWVLLGAAASIVAWFWAR